jgi:hypothetical protein
MRIVLASVVFIALLLGIGTLRQLRIGARAIAESDDALAHGDVAVAIARARTAAQAVAPSSPYPARAYARLEAIARDAEAHGDGHVALDAWSAMRAATLETDAIGLDTSRWRAMAEEGILRVGAQSWSGPDARATGDGRPTEALLAMTLARPDVPATWAFVLLAAGAISFFAGAARLLWVSPDRAALKRARLASLATVVGAALYVVACLRG